MRKIMFAGAVLTLAIGGAAIAQDGAASAPAPQAVAILHDAQGKDVGRAAITTAGDGLAVSLQVTALPPGDHGTHIHAIGKCDAPDFASAGGHWNPTGMHHGSMNPQGPHEGDLPNLTVGADGTGTLAFTVPHATLASLMDADGAAIVVHATADDLKSDPAGNSGARIACGVLTAG